MYIISAREVRRSAARLLAIGLAASCSLLLVAACGGDDDDSSANSSDESSAADFDAYVGLTEEEAGEKAEDAGLTWRVIARDGEALPATMDYNPDRLNFAIADGEVTLVTTG